MNAMLERMMWAAALEAVKPYVRGFAGGKRWSREHLGRSLAERLDATILPPSEDPVDPPLPPLWYCATLYLGTDGHLAFWCLWSPGLGWHIHTSKGWARTGAVAPPQYEAVCHCYDDSRGIEPALQPAC